MKILFTCDLHGRQSLYEEMFRLTLHKNVDCLIIGGDLLPTLINPIKLISGNFDFNNDLRLQFNFIDSYLVPVLSAFMKEHPHIHMLYIPGNHDWKAAVTHIEKSIPGAVNLHEKTLNIKDITFIGYGCVTDSPFWVKDYVRLDKTGSVSVSTKYPFISTPEGLHLSRNGEYAYKKNTIEEELSGFTCTNPEKTICVFHCPPYNTGIDTLHDNKPIGSRSIQEFIEQKKPFISLHGHIHEAPYMSDTYQVMIGNCLAINPGQGPKGFHAVTFETNDPSATLEHSLFGKGSPAFSGFERITDRYARRIKGYFIKKVLMDN